MESVKRWLKSFFLLSGSQANGLMVLLPLLFMLIVSEPLWRWWHIRHWEPDPRDAVKLDSLVKAWRVQVPAGSDSSPASRTESRAREYFPFDPNKATAAELISLGFNERLAHRIENYRKKGGVFKVKQDLLKIYGMDSALYRQLANYMEITQEFGARRKESAPGPWGAKKRTTFARSGAQPKRATDTAFDINLADTARLEAVRGIGEKLSRRIIKYRSSLGGFVYVGQLKEVFGLDSVVLVQMMQTAFVAPDFLPHRIDLNLADEKVLEAHPYIGRQEARTIVAYRFQHGRFASVSDLRKLPMFSDEKVRQLEPYLKTVE